METDDFDYNLPVELIAQTAAEPRDNSRLMAVSRTDDSIEHRHFYQLSDYLCAGDVIVFNNSRALQPHMHQKTILYIRFVDCFFGF